MCCNNINYRSNRCNRCSNTCGCRCANPFVVCRGYYQRTFVNLSSLGTDTDTGDEF